MPLLEVDSCSWTSFRISSVYTPGPGVDRTDGWHESSRHEERSPLAWCLRFGSSVTRFKLGEAFPNQKLQDASVLAFPIHDQAGDTCGRVQLPSIFQFSTSNLNEFILLKDSAYGAEYRSETFRKEYVAYNSRLSSGYTYVIFIPDARSISMS